MTTSPRPLSAETITIPRRDWRQLGTPGSRPYRPGPMPGLGVPAADRAPGEPRAITPSRPAMEAGRQSAIPAQSGGYAAAEQRAVQVTVGSRLLGGLSCALALV